MASHTIPVLKYYFIFPPLFLSCALFSLHPTHFSSSRKSDAGSYSSSRRISSPLSPLQGSFVPCISILLYREKTSALYFLVELHCALKRHAWRKQVGVLYSYRVQANHLKSCELAMSVCKANEKPYLVPDTWRTQVSPPPHNIARVPHIVISLSCLA